METFRVALASLVLVIPSITFAAGFAHNENFIVLAADQQLAEAVLARADTFREEVAKEWLGEELPPSIGRAVIQVELTDKQDSGLTWAIDHPDRKLHSVWLTTNGRQSLDSALRHEVTHVVLATRFPERLPAWVEEGIASRSDTPERMATRRSVTDWYARTGNWPRLASLINAPTILADETDRYSVAASLVDFLLARGDRKSLLEFAMSGKTQGWDEAVRQYYNLAGIHELETAWRAWASRSSSSVAHSALRESNVSGSGAN